MLFQCLVPGGCIFFRNSFLYLLLGKRLFGTPAETTTACHTKQAVQSPGSVFSSKTAGEEEKPSCSTALRM